MLFRGLVFALLANLTAFGAASANPVTWTLQDWVFDDGGTASGSFVFDADTGVYSSINIITTAGSTLSGDSYGVPFPPYGGNEEIMLAVPEALADLTGSLVLAVTWADLLTNAGGSVYADLMESLVAEFICLDATCFKVDSARFLVSGFITSEVPLPAALPLFAAGLAGVASLRRRKKPSAA